MSQVYPSTKKVLFFVALLPMTMQLFASVSADGSIICAGIALITYVLYARNTMTRKLNFWDFLLLLFICLVLTLTKPVYAFICPIIFWIPKERFKSQKWKLGTIFTLGGICLLSILGTSLLSFSTAEGRFGDTHTQTDLLFHQPLRVLFIIFMNIVQKFDFYIYSTFGYCLEWFNLEYYYPYVLMLIIIFAILCLERKEATPVSLRIYSVIAFTLVVVTTFISMFISWSQPGTTLIEGVQGRYFLPAILLIPLACLNSQQKSQKITKKDLKSDNRELINPTTLFTMVSLIDIYVITTIVAFHIVG